MAFFSGRDIKKGEVVHVLSGERMNLGEFVKRVNSKKEYYSPT